MRTPTKNKKRRRVCLGLLRRAMNYSLMPRTMKKMRKTRMTKTQMMMRTKMPYLKVFSSRGARLKKMMKIKMKDGSG